MNRITFSAIVLLLIQILMPRSVLAQPPIVLRDLSLIRDKAISDFDRNAIALFDAGSKTAPSRQTEFNDYLKQMELPLFRLKTRIKQGDWAGAGKIGAPMFDSVIAGKSDFPNPDVEYLVCQATMKSRIGRGEQRKIEPALYSRFCVRRGPKHALAGKKSRWSQRLQI